MGWDDGTIKLEDKMQGCEMPSSEHGTTNVITNAQKLYFPALCLHKTGPVDNPSWFGVGLMDS